MGDPWIGMLFGLFIMFVGGSVAVSAALELLAASMKKLANSGTPDAPPPAQELPPPAPTRPIV